MRLEELSTPCLQIAKQSLYYSIMLGLFLASPNVALAVEVPANAQPGAILQNQIQNQQLQTQAPWLNRPVEGTDMEAPLIDIRQIDAAVQGQIVPPSTETPATDSLTPP